jgi:hypothetical protein
VAKLIKIGEAPNHREAAKIIAAEEEADYLTIEREARRVRQEREKAGGK